MKNKINYEQIIEIASYGILIAIVVFWNFFSNLFPIKLEQVISILIGLIAATNIAWTRKFNKMEKKIDPLKTSEMLVYPDLQSAFNAILSKKNGSRHSEPTPIHPTSSKRLSGPTTSSSIIAR